MTTVAGIRGTVRSQVPLQLQCRPGFENAADFQARFTIPGLWTADLSMPGCMINVTE
jgi:hypothetical protein